ncbi:unnamed protein product [Spirodela intermedia]|uniref:Uncharacterized protein n=1 Tax=Spirodela intermedia TaxID=51605 RepID=A0ABN7EA82_SPIIN|nr:unnamed protein product [Spirodela intermedia]
MSVNIIPGGCLRHWYSSTSLRISLLHVEFYPPLTYSSLVVSNAVPKLSSGISHLTYKTACARFTPISRCFLSRYRQPHTVLLCKFSSLAKELYNRRPSSLTRNGWIRLAPIVQNSPLLPPVGVWTVSQFQCGWSSSQTSY